MAKRKSKKPIHVMTVTAEMQFQTNKPRYNAYACGHGVHGDTSYNRRRTKRETRALLAEYR